MKTIRKLEVGEIAMMTLPDYVSTVFYPRPGIQYWANYAGTAFGDSKPHSLREIRKALTWLVEQNGGKITWEKS